MFLANDLSHLILKEIVLAYSVLKEIWTISTLSEVLKRICVILTYSKRKLKCYQNLIVYIELS